MKEDVLKRMEADEAILVVGLHHKKNDGRNNGDVSEHTGNVVGHTAGGGDGRSSGGTACRGLACALSARRTGHRTFRHLSAAGRTKTRHISPPEKKRTL